MHSNFCGHLCANNNPRNPETLLHTYNQIWQLSLLFFMNCEWHV